MNIYEHRLYPWLTGETKFIEQSIKNQKTVIGICLGAHLIADILGQKVYSGHGDTFNIPTVLSTLPEARPATAGDLFTTGVW